MADFFSDPAFWTLIIFLCPLLIKIPIAVALGGASFIIAWNWGLGFPMVSYNFFAGIAKFQLLAIPFFILAGVIMEKAGIAERIITFIKEVVGDVTGGLAIATVAVATFWGLFLSPKAAVALPWPAALGLEADEVFLMGGIEKKRVLDILKPHLFFDDQMVHLEPVAKITPSVHVPFGIANKSAG